MSKKLIFVFIFALIFNSSISHAKGGGEQDQIILLNDSAAALEDSNPELSKKLAQFADEQEKDWEAKNANKSASPMIVKNTAQLQEQIKLLKSAALAVQPAYPLIAKSLNKMEKDLEKTIEIKK